MALKLDLVGKPLKPFTFAYDARDTMLYGLGIGAGVDDLDFVFELRGPKVYPTFAVVAHMDPMFDAIIQLNANLLTLLHGEQTVILHAPIPPKATLTTTATVSHVYDKGKGALMLVDSQSVDAKGNLLFENRSSLFCRGEGGFGGEPGPKAQAFEPPAGAAPTFSQEDTTLAKQALVYRLSGDRNPLHVDPGFAKMAGFERPILHGLCTFGYLGRALLHHACGDDPKRFRKLSARFTDVVFPGDVVTSEGWRVEDGRYHLRVRTGRGTTVIANAFAEVAE